ncbi:hypothetical protein BGZ58_002126 [Dissophora ornata]|nr:hypothetical protein BGZ58_002126 [Dissophora ornata]
MPSDVRVTIVGGGIGGLALANMFEKANITYIVLEKATTIRALGSSLGLDATSLPVMEQLGLLDDFYGASKALRHFNFYSDSLKTIGKVDFSDLKEIGGYPAIILDRPAFYNILLKNLPKHKILYNKRVLSITQNDEGATAKCSDGRSLKEKGLLSASDDKAMGYNQHCLVGVSEPLDPEQYPVLTEDYADFEIVIPKSEPFYAIYMPLPGNRMSWAVIQNVQRGDAEKGEGFRFSEWGPEATMEMANFVRHQPNPFGGTLGDIIDKSPNISKIMLEEKFFEAWYEDRVVLLGDATPENIAKVFQAYYHRRAPIAKAALGKSRQFGKVMGDRGPVSQLIRKLFLGHMPDKLTRQSNIQRVQYRPQLHFLPQISELGSCQPRPQEPRLVFRPSSV